MSKASDAYEKFTQQVIKELVGVKVHHKKTYTGRVSQRDIIVDVSFNYSVLGSDLLFLVECKCYNYKISVDEVEEFHSKIDDIGAHKGIMVTTLGYQSGAIKTAKGRGIGLALLSNKHQNGELTYIVNTVVPVKMPIQHEGFWQGNYRGPLGNYEGGYRFESFGQFIGILCMDAYEDQRKDLVAKFEREHESR